MQRYDGANWQDVTYEDESTGFPHYNTIFVYPKYDETYGITGAEPTNDLSFQYELKSQKKSGDTVTTIFEDPGWYELKQEVTYSGDGSVYDLRYEVTNTSSEGYWFRLFRYHAVADPYADGGAVAQGSGYYLANVDEVGLRLRLDGEDLEYGIRAVTPSRAHQVEDYETVEAAVIDGSDGGLDETVRTDTFKGGYAMSWSSGSRVLGDGGTWVVEAREKFTAWSIVSNPRLGNDGAGNLTFSFDTEQPLGDAALDIAVSVDGPNTDDVYTFDGDAFSESGSGPYTYTLTTTQAYDNGLGTYVARIDDAFTGEGRDGANGTESDGYELRPGPADADRSEIRATGPHSAGGVDASRVTVQLKDANGYELTSGGDTVVVTATGSAKVSSVTDNGNGTYSATVTDAVAETVALRATVNGRAIASGNPNVVFEADTAAPDEDTSTGVVSADESTSRVSVTGPHTADGVDASTVTVQLRDPDGNDLTAGGDSVAISTTGLATVSPVTDHEDGTYTAKVTNTMAETVTVSAMVNGTTLTSGSPTVEFRPDNANPDPTTSRISVTTPHSADGEAAATVTVQLKDENGNYLTEGGEAVAITTSGSAVVSSVTDNGDGTYTATVTSTEVGMVTVRASVNGESITTGNRGIKFFRCEGWRRSVGHC